MKKVLIVGAGLAGTEAALFLAKHGVPVVLAECKVGRPNPAQKLKTCAELVCTNSLKSVQPETGHGLLKVEMQALGSNVLEVGFQTAVPAGDALAVDRVLFSEELTRRLKNNPGITMVDEEITDPLEAQKRHGCDFVVLATGPLTSPGLTNWIQEKISAEDFYFYDAIAPVVDADSLDFSKLYYKDRGRRHRGAEVPVEEKAEADYLNSPLTEEEYYRFVDELIKAEKVAAKDFEEYVYFESCLPIDTMAERGRDTPRFSCMKPVGLTPDDGFQGKSERPPFAVVQLRKENLLGDAFNLVGFQTRLTYKEQVRVFRMIPGLENAQFIHLGSVHRNSFLNARRLLHPDLSSREYPWLYFAGQMTGVEGYTESAMTGLYVGSQILRRISGLPAIVWPTETATGALINYLMTGVRPRPSNFNFGLLPPVELPRGADRPKRYEDKKAIKKRLLAERTRSSFDSFMRENFLMNRSAENVEAGLNL